MFVPLIGRKDKFSQQFWALGFWVSVFSNLECLIGKRFLKGKANVAHFVADLIF